MELTIFDNLNNASELKNYSDEDILEILYAIGWYNNYKISPTYQFNKCINNNIETPSYKYCKKFISGINPNFLSSRSLHTKKIEIKNTSANIAIQIATTISEMINYIQTISNHDDMNVSIILNDTLAKAIVNNTKSYNSLKIAEHKKAGDKIIQLGSIKGTPIFINLLQDSDDTRIFAFGDEDLYYINQYLTTYIKL